MQFPSAQLAAYVVLMCAVTAATAGVIAWVAVAAPPEAGTSRWRWPSLAAGTGLLVIAFLSPLADLAGRYLLTAHLLQVTLVMGFAPPLLLLGLPARTDRHLARWVCRVGRTVTHPIVAIVLVNAVFFGAHAAVLYNAAIANPALYGLQQTAFLLVSLVFWWPIVGPRASARTGMSTFQKLGYILFATIPQTFAGMTMALAKHPLYAAYAAAPRRWGMSVISDQQVAGACMALVSKLALFVAFTVVFARMLGEKAPDDDDGGGGPRQLPDAPAPSHTPLLAPEWLGLIRDGRTVSEPTVRERSANRSYRGGR